MEDRDGRSDALGWIGDPPAGTQMEAPHLRSRTSVRVHYVIQPLLLLAVLIMVLAAMDGFDGRNHRPSPDAHTRKLWMTRRKRRLELRGTRDEWQAWAEEQLTDAFAKADDAVARSSARAAAAAEAHSRPQTEPRAPRVGLARSDRRLLSTADIVEIAHRHGWVITWEGHRRADKSLHLTRLTEANAAKINPAPVTG